MSRYLSEETRQIIVARARNCCEYCLINIDDTYFGGEIDHIISIKHGGGNKIENLAFACQPCNRNKGSDIASRNVRTGRIIRFFSPRRDSWKGHFQLQGALIIPRTNNAEVNRRNFVF